jgi:xylan 1,4-beta-xylosidase
MTAEGGTGYEHAVTVARSRSVEGPYEIDPENPIVTSGGKPGLELQKAGHASIVETQTGEWYLVHLTGRPVGPERRCILGRETAIQKCVWTNDGWLRLEGGGNDPKVSVPAPDLPKYPFETEPARDDFDSEELNIHFQSLRVPMDDSWLSLKERPGWLRLYGRESLSSRHRQSLIARRVQAFRCEASTCLEFEPENFQQMAGITAFYDVTMHYYLFVSGEEGKGKYLNLFSLDVGNIDFPLEQEVSIDGWERIYLKVTFDYETLQFAYSQDGENWRNIGPAFDATKLSDDYDHESFTGAFIGLCVQDLSGQRKHTDFNWFEYTELSTY